MSIFRTEQNLITFFGLFLPTASLYSVMSIYQGNLYKLGEKGLIKTWKYRFFEIKESYIHYCKSKGGSEIGKIDLKLGFNYFIRIYYSISCYFIATEVVVNSQNKGKGTFGFEVFRQINTIWYLLVNINKD